MKEIEFRIESRLENIGLLGASINRICSLVASMEDTQAYEVELAVVEAVNNVIFHAYKNRDGEIVSVACSVSEEEITFEICDTGKAIKGAQWAKSFGSVFEFDPTNLKSVPDKHMGLEIIKKTMDRIAYKSEEDGRNVLTLAKKFNAVQAQEVKKV